MAHHYLTLTSCASSQSGDERGVDEMYMAGLDWEETVGWEEDR
jgi:hypothetical protein